MTPDSRALYGIDFSSAPTRRKPIVIAQGIWNAHAPDRVTLQGLTRLDTLEAFGRWLLQPGPWVGVFDLPFGLPRELIDILHWPGHRGDPAAHPWPRLIQHVRAQTRAELRAVFRQFCAARPPGAKFAHRACDRPAGSSPSMKWVNPPVAWMLHAAAPLLLDAGVDLPGLHAGDPQRVALEGYPGFAARAVLGRRSYKSDARNKQTAERQSARDDLLHVLQTGQHPMGLRLLCTPTLRQTLLLDASGDPLDAALCLLQAGWAVARHAQNWGLPPQIDPVEGWIVSVPPE